MDSFLNNINAILDVHAPLKKVNKFKLKFKTKPWITPALQKSISVKNNLLKKFITAKDSQVKERLQTTVIKRLQEHAGTGTALKTHGKA